jgi:hypothetical protein
LSLVKSAKGARLVTKRRSASMAAPRHRSGAKKLLARLTLVRPARP